MALRDWSPFPRPRPVGREPGPVLAAALADLDRLIASRPELAGAGRSLAVVLRAAFLTPARAAPPHADPEVLTAAWRAGVPAFRAGDSPPALDQADLRARMVAILEGLSAENTQALSLLDAIRSGRVEPHAWAVAVLADRADEVDAAALGLDPLLVRSVLRMALLPVLARHSEALAPLRPDGLWTRGDCPHCGGPPTLAESRGLEQRRYWRCGLCAADWEGERLRCPYCGESDHRRLSYLFVEGEQERYRLSLCSSCDGRLKVVATLGPLSAPALLVVELATIHLDMAQS